MARLVIETATKIPWEHLFMGGTALAVARHAHIEAVSSEPAPVALPVADSASGDQAVEDVYKPGCVVADSVGLIKFYLDGLARGRGGFGVLRIGKEHLDKGVAAAEQLGQTDLAAKLNALAEQLPNVRSKEHAAALARQMEPLAAKAWRLGRACGLTRKETVSQ